LKENEEKAQQEMKEEEFKNDIQRKQIVILKERKQKLADKDKQIQELF